MAEQKVYPNFSVANNAKPNRFLNFPFLGVIVKVVILIPVFVELSFLSLAAFFVLFVNWFVVLFTGKYWDTAYSFFLSLMRFTGKIQLYILGITDTYPGFALNTNGLFELTIAKPEKPNRWFAVPFFGIFVRFILLIPYIIFTNVLLRGSEVAMFFSWFTILFKGNLPESLYEFEKDSLRVSFAGSSYLLGLSDTYPSFAISMNHQTVKILLIIAGTILVLSRMNGDYARTYNRQSPNHRYYYQQNFSPRAGVPTDNKTY